MPSLPPHLPFPRAACVVSCQDSGCWQCPISPQKPLPLGPMCPMAGTGLSHTRAHCTKHSTQSPEEAWGGPAEHRSQGASQSPAGKPQCRYSFLRSLGGRQSSPHLSPPSHRFLEVGWGVSAPRLVELLREEHAHISRRASPRTGPKFGPKNWAQISTRKAHTAEDPGPQQVEPWLVLKLRTHGRAPGWLTR